MKKHLSVSEKFANMFSVTIFPHENIDKAIVCYYKHRTYMLISETEHLSPVIPLESLISSIASVDNNQKALTIMAAINLISPYPEFEKDLKSYFPSDYANKVDILGHCCERNSKAIFANGLEHIAFALIQLLIEMLEKEITEINDKKLLCAKIQLLGYYNDTLEDILKKICEGAK